MWVASRPQSLYFRVFITPVAKNTSKTKNTPTNQKEKTKQKQTNRIQGRKKKKKGEKISNSFSLNLHNSGLTVLKGKTS